MVGGIAVGEGGIVGSGVMVAVGDAVAGVIIVGVGGEAVAVASSASSVAWIAASTVRSMSGVGSPWVGGIGSDVVQARPNITNAARVIALIDSRVSTGSTFLITSGVLAWLG